MVQERAQCIENTKEYEILKNCSLPWFIANLSPEYYLSGNFLTVDFETTNTDKGSALSPENRILLATWARGATGEVIGKWGNEYDQNELLEEIGRAKFIVAHNCFAGDTKFLTKNGVVSFKDSVNTDVEVWNESGWQPAKVKYYGKAATKKITLVPYNRSRTSIVRNVVATDNHRWKIDRLFSKNKIGRFRKEVDGYIRTDELKVGDKIWGRAPNVSIHEDSDGFRHGLIFADGAKCSNRAAYKIRLCGWKECYKDLFPKYTYPKSANGDPVVNYYCSNIPLKELPPEDFAASYKAAFIEGWQKLDGTDSGNGTSRTVQTINKEAAEWLRDNAILAGYFVSGFSCVKTSGYNNGTWIYNIVLTKNQDMGWTVRAVEEASYQDVYCVEVDGLDRFTLDHGIYTGNCKFELQWFKRMGVDISNILVYDTMLAEYVIAGNRSWDLDLDSVCSRYGVAQKGSIVKHMMKSGVCPSDIPESLLYTYGIGDTANTREMFLKQRDYIFANNLQGVVYTRCLTCTCLADIETYGMFLDGELVTKEFDIVSQKLGELDSALHRFTGGINPNSPKQLTEFVYDKLGFREITDRNGEPSRTAKGGRRADADTLAQLSANTPDQEQFKQLILARQEENTKLKSVKKMKECVDKDGGILYAKFNQTITQTHRLSSSGSKHKLQFQNFHRPYKPLFKARQDGWLLGESDGAQLEFRVAADLGNDEQARTDIREKVDVHRNTASVLWKIPSTKVTKTQRQAAKAETFKPLI